ncbi:MAG: single-stranded DNA-binding protein, partial [Treponema sp.]
KFSVAVNRRKKAGEEWVDEVSFFDVVFWGKMGESINQYLVKGKQVAVTGELRQNRWEQDGQPRSKVEIIANNLQLLGTAQGNGKQYQNTDSYSEEGGYQKRRDVPQYDEFADDESQLDNIPF